MILHVQMPHIVDEDCDSHALEQFFIKEHSINFTFVRVNAIH